MVGIRPTRRNTGELMSFRTTRRLSKKKEAFSLKGHHCEFCILLNGKEPEISFKKTFDNVFFKTKLRFSNGKFFSNWNRKSDWSPRQKCVENFKDRKLEPTLRHIEQFRFLNSRQADIEEIQNRIDRRQVVIDFVKMVRKCHAVLRCRYRKISNNLIV